MWVATVALFALMLLGGLLMGPRLILAQSPSSLSDEDLLSLVLPPLADGSRPGVHRWARADQDQGPSGLPTVFVVTLYTKYAANGPEEHEIVNYVQYTNGGWAPARPRDDGTLLVNDWAWISLNLTDLSASVAGSGSNSRYTVNYAASGPYGSGTRQIAIEEVYGADLSLQSSTVLSDTNPSSGGTTTTVAPTSSATPRPAATATATTLAPVTTATPRPAATAPSSPTLTPTSTAPSSSGSSVLVPPSGPQAQPTPPFAVPVLPPQASGPNIISPAAAASSTPTATAAHIYYASNAANASTIYCDTDPDWQQLSQQNLMSFTSLAAAMSAFPSYHLHQPC
jgi:hypothetical protein